MARLLITAGIILILLGAAAAVFSFFNLNLFHLPGDIVIKKGPVTVYIPIMTSILISIALSLLLWFFGR